MIKLKQISVSLIGIFIISVIFTSCKVLSTSNGFVDMTFNYNPTNFHYIKTVYGSHTESYVMGRLKSGDPNGKGLNNEALWNLKREAQLKSNQTFINVAYDVKETKRWNRLDISVNISADVIELSNKSLNEVESVYLENLKVSTKHIKSEIEYNEYVKLPNTSKKLINKSNGKKYSPADFIIGSHVEINNQYEGIVRGVVIKIKNKQIILQTEIGKSFNWFSSIIQAYDILERIDE